MVVNKKRIISFVMSIFCITAVLALSGCSKADSKPDFVIATHGGSRTDDAVGFQLDEPAAGEEVAVIETSEGTVKIRLFPDSAPIGVANFKGLVNKGYYDGLSFHRIVTDFVAQTGDPTGTGTGGKSLWGDEFETEVNNNLLHLKGAVAYANRGAGTNSSQIYFVTCTEVDEQDLITYPRSKDERDLYAEYGGTPYLDYAKSYTVFGQVYEGLDVLDKINKCGSAETEGTPTKEVTIIKATIEKI